MQFYETPSDRTAPAEQLWRKQFATKTRGIGFRPMPRGQSTSSGLRSPILNRGVKNQASD
jgi:hypothetical protein